MPRRRDIFMSDEIVEMFHEDLIVKTRDQLHEIAIDPKAGPYMQAAALKLLENETWDDDELDGIIYDLEQLRIEQPYLTWATFPLIDWLRDWRDDRDYIAEHRVTGWLGL